MTLVDGIATITLDRAPVNAMDPAMVDAFRAALQRVARSGARAVLITSAQRQFSAGADIKSVASMLPEVDGVDSVVRFVESMQTCWAELEALAIPTIAALRGAALGGGLELALACDVRIAGASARVGLPEVGLGVLPAAGGTQRLAAVIGYAGAANLMLTGDAIDSAAAYRLGVVQIVVPDELLDEESQRYARQIAEKDPAAVRAIKRCLRAGTREDGFRAERDATRDLYGRDTTTTLIRRFVDGG